jgi:hypothetical protein
MIRREIGHWRSNVLVVCAIALVALVVVSRAYAHTIQAYNVIYYPGHEHADWIHGHPGDSDLFGQRGPDRLYGEDGNDWLWGGRGHDLLDGGDGYDICVGGRGDDTFIRCEVIYTGDV